MSETSPRLLRGSLDMVAANVFLMGTSYVTLLMVARALGIERFGYYSVVTAILLWLERISSESFKHPLIRQFTKGTLEGLRGVLRIQLFVALTIVLLLVLGAPSVASLLGEDKLLVPLRAAALDVVPFAIYASLVSAFMACDRYGWSALSGVVYGTSRLVLMVSAAFVFQSVASVICALAIASSIAALFCYLQLKRTGVYAALADSIRDVGRSTVPHGFGFAVAIIGGSGVLLAADIWLVQASSVTATTVGLYAASHNVSKVLYMGASALMWPLIPSLARAGGFRAALQTNRHIKTLVQLLCVGLVVAVLVFATFSEHVIVLLFGEAFVGGAQFLPMLAVGHAILSLALISAQCNYHIGMQRSAAAVVIIGALLFVACGRMATEAAGVMAVPYTLIAVASAMVLMNVFLSLGRRSKAK